MQDILIVGSGGFAKEVAFLIECINASSPQWNILGYVAQNEAEIGNKNGKYAIAMSDDMLLNIDRPVSVAVGIGDPQVIAKLVSKLKKNNNIYFPNLIHPNVFGGWDQIEMGEGNIICAGSIFSIDIEIGSFNIFNLGCIIGHDSDIGDFNVLNPSVIISGGVKLGNQNLIGTGSKILQYLTICDNNKIGAGSLINYDITEPGTYVVAPARRVR